tara:strand:+ start:246 stop:758 length:513 start_codon:yes stop_codon:yes gene_type:complete
MWKDILKAMNPRKRDKLSMWGGGEYFGEGYIDYFSSLSDAIQIGKKRAKQMARRKVTKYNYRSLFDVGKVKDKKGKIMYYLSTAHPQSWKKEITKDFVDFRTSRDFGYMQYGFSIDVFGFVFDDKVNNYTKVAEEHMTPAEIDDFKNDKLYSVIIPFHRPEFNDRFTEPI